VVLVLDNGALVARIAPGRLADGDRHFWTTPVIEHDCFVEGGVCQRNNDILASLGFVDVKV
jgi:hypothetical protein